MNWDLAVDIVCTGQGAAGLATAISAVDLGGDVFVATSPGVTPRAAVVPIASHANRMYPWLLSNVSDAETKNYLAALSSDLGTFRRGGWEPDVPICVVHDPPVESGRLVTPFVGARLRDWAARCLASPYGFLHTRVAEWGTTPMHTADGEMIEVAEIGSMAPDFDNISGSVLGWLTAQAGDRDIEIHPNFSLRRIVFEEGEAIGVVFATPDGRLAVRARHGVTVATGSTRINTPSAHQFSDVAADLRVGLVSRHASRFGRLELLTSDPIARLAPSTCRPCSRQVRANLRETRGQSPTRRCARGDGYPAAGQ